MANITVKEQLYLLGDGDDESIYKHTFWDYEFADIVYKKTIEELSTLDRPLTFDTFFEEIVMSCFFGRCRDSIIEDTMDDTDDEVIEAAMKMVEYADVDEDTIENADEREGAIDLMAMISCDEQSHMVYQEAKAFLDAVGIFVIDDLENERDDVFNDPNNVLFHSEDKRYIHSIYCKDGLTRRLRFYNNGDSEFYTEYDQFVGELDSKGSLSIRRNPYSYV